MTNDQFCQAMRARGLSPADVASELELDPRTVLRWAAGQVKVPQTEHRRAVAKLLGEEEENLFPAAAEAAQRAVRAIAGPESEVVRIYQTNAAILPATWRGLIEGTREQIFWVSITPYWAWEKLPKVMTKLINRKIAEGVNFRAVIGDPDDPAIAADEAATQMAMTLSSRMRYGEQLLGGIDGAADRVRVHPGVIVGQTVFQFDDRMVSHVRLFGRAGSDFPALELRRRVDGGIFDALHDHATEMWEDEGARPLVTPANRVG